MRDLGRELRFAFRFLRRSPTFAITAILVLAVGIGANTAVFTATYAIVLKPLPYPDADRIVEIRASRLVPARVDAKLLSTPLTQDLQRVSGLQILGRFMPGTFTIAGEAEPQQVPGAYVTPEWFAALGIAPIIGRTVGAGDLEAGNDQVVVLSHALWRTLGADPAVLGKQLLLGAQPAGMLLPFAPRGKPYTVIGVMPERRGFPVDGSLWVPLRLEAFATNAKMSDPRRPRMIGVIARLADDRTLTAANLELSALATTVGRDFPQTDGGWNLEAVPLRHALGQNHRSILGLLLFSVSLVLALACVSLSGLLIARNVQRRRDVAIRQVLGAHRGQVVRQCLTETLLLAVGGGTLGVVSASWILGLVRRFAPPTIPRLDDLALDPWILAYAAGVSLCAGLLIGVAPAVQLTAPQLAATLQADSGSRGEGAGQSFRLRGLLIGVQIAIVFPLAVGAILMIRTLDNLSRVDLGYQKTAVVSATLKFTATTCAKFDACNVAVSDVLERLRALPGVQAAALSGSRPLSMTVSLPIVFGRDWDRNRSQPLQVQYQMITPDYFRTLGIPLHSGRIFQTTDVSGAPMVAIVNETLARTALGGQAIGKVINLAPAGRISFFEIVGVVADTRDSAITKQPTATFYVPFAQSNLIPRTVLLARTSIDPRVVAPSITAAVHAVDPQAPVTSVQTMSEIIEEHVQGPRFQAWLLTGFAGLGLVLVLVGIYGLISYATSSRVKEFGIRLALGAQSRDIWRLVVGESLSTLGWSLTSGLAAAVFFARFLRNELFEIGPADPLTFGVVLVVISVAALCGYFLPAWKAMKVDPLIVMRHE